jgi:hypothetical protein
LAEHLALHAQGRTHTALASGRPRLRTLSDNGTLPLLGDSNEEPFAKYLAERRKQRRWSRARFLDSGDAPPAESRDE